MTDVLPCMCLDACQADDECRFQPCFQACLDVARDGHQAKAIRMRANACARHLGA